MVVLSLQDSEADSLQMSTIFTILFAATVGRALRSLTLWLLERGSTIGFLDRLLGSMTVSGTLVTNLVTRIPTSFMTTVFVVILIILWSLSPLGSQAVLRIVRFESHMIVSQLERHYLNTTRWQSLPGAGSTSQLDLIPANALLNAAVISSLSSKAIPQDLWGNVRIPRLEDLNTSKADNQGWVPVGPVKYLSYSSLVGIPVGALPQEESKSSVMKIESWYWNLDCDPWHNSSSEKVDYTKWDAQYDTNFTSEMYPSTQAINIFMNLSSLNRTQDFCKTECPVGTDVHYCPTLPARELGVVLRDNDDFYLNKCRFNTTHVETEILCANSSCHATRMRNSRLPNLPPANWSVFDLCINRTEGEYYNFNNALYRFALNLADAFIGRLNGGGGSNVFAGYISTPANPLPPSLASPADDQNILHATDDVITKGLAQVLNTYWITNLAGGMIVGGGDDDFRFFDPYDTTLDGSTANTSLLEISNATVSTKEQKMTCDIVWLTIFTVSTVVALACSVASLVLVQLTQGPRLAFNVSSLARDSPYVNLPFQASYLDDDDRSKLAADTTVTMGDVAPGDEETGHIALSSLENNSQRLRPGRLYD